MPIVGPVSYFVVTQAFINHWSDANAAHGSAILLNKDELELPADASIAILQGLLGTLEARRDVVEDVAQDLSIQRAVATGLREFLITKMGDFNDMMRAEHGSSVYGQSLSLVPGINDGRDALLKPMRDTNRLWAKVNAWRLTLGKTELLTKGGYSQSAFNSAVTAARAALDELEEQEQQLGIEIRKRNIVQDQIYPILKVYRLKIPAVFPEGDAMISSLPALTPAIGTTPATPGLTMGWSAANARAEGSGTASPTSAVTQHQLRAVSGPVHDENTEVVVQTIEVGQPLAFATTWGLTVPGGVASYRLVAMTGDGHERGSPPTVVSRPLA